MTGTTEGGYYRFPTIHGKTIIFVSEDDLWTVPAAGGLARRLTSDPGMVSNPALSPDGQYLAFSGRDEGHWEVYVMAAIGGPAHRLTHLGARSWVAGWTPDGHSIVFASDSGQPFDRLSFLHAVELEGGEPRRLDTGPAFSLSYGPKGGLVIGRHTSDLAHWKRYRGGLAGDLWIDPAGDGDWRRLIRLEGNLAQPLWVGQRIYFVSDHEGIGNLYSCRPDGNDLRRHTHHQDYYVRHPSTDGRRIVYHAGAELFVFDPSTNEARQVAIEYHSSQSQRKRKFVDAGRYLQDYNLHPGGLAVALTVRGKPFVMTNWEGPAIPYGQPGGVRYRLVSWLSEGPRLVMISDIGGEEALEIYNVEPGFAQVAGEEKGDLVWSAPTRLDGLDVGRVTEMLVSPIKDEVALTNHRFELMVVSLADKTARVLDRSRYGQMSGMAWSPDGRWLAYGFATTRQTSIIKLCRVATGETYEVTRPVLRDTQPAFDPDGRYLYFLSYRDFDPVYDNIHFNLTFPWGVRLYLVTLQADLTSPFVPLPRAPGEKPPRPMARQEVSETAETKEEEAPTEGEEQPEKEPPGLQIDLEGIADRVVAFPIEEGRYRQVRAIRDKVLFSSFPLEGALQQSWLPETVPSARGRIEAFDLVELKEDVLIEGVTDFDVSMDGKTLIYRSGEYLRLLRAGEKPEPNGRGANRKTGWLDLERIRVSINPAAEWEQMYREAWRLQRDYFWNPEMSGVDWQMVYQRYLPLLKRVAARSEFSDLMWEMQGELGTSHAYEFGGDYRPEPKYDQGFLAADFQYDAESDSYRLTHVVQGDVWDENASSPLCRPGLKVRPGDRLIAVNGRRVDKHTSPRQLLVNQANNEVLLTFALTPPPSPSEGEGAGGEGDLHTIWVRALGNETPARYRQWVDSNRQRVHEATNGRAGYIHIPDMGARGYAEFHRGYLAELEREGLIIDVRFNGGGHVSGLILQKLAQRRLGYDVRRWGEPLPYPEETVKGPLVALTNEQAGSDGDMFCHAFKMMGLGPLIGKRTWGGVVGITVDDTLVDGGVTTQPAFSLWLEDVGWGLENYGTVPDIEVEYRPQDYVAGRDPQLERAIEEILQRLATHPPRTPDFGQRPRLSLPVMSIQT
ncbi:MAG: S41 family peptidase [Chloroflexota bacterium]